MKSAFYFIDRIPTELVNLMIKNIDDISIEDYQNGEVAIDVNLSHENHDGRNCKIHWLNDASWIGSLFSHYFNIANEENWEYDLTRIEDIQLTKYGIGQHYNWHNDYFEIPNSKYTRKLSASLLITDPSEYSGGEFEFIDYSGQKVSYKMKKGTMVVFDSRLPHRVCPVTHGTRTSLVSWMLGPKLR